jgi:small conductance mechanosensitive channel
VTEPVTSSLLDGQPEWAEVALALGLAFLVSTVVAVLLGRLVRVVLTAIYGGEDHPRRLIASPIFVTRIVSFLLVFPLAALPMLDAIGQQFDVGLDQKSVLRWLFASGLRIVVIVTIAWLIIRVVSGSTRRLEIELSRGTDADAADRLRRAQTLGRLVTNVVGTLVGTVALLMVLRELNVDVMPMLTGAGIAGVALGFGAQWLVRDVIAGFFLILEDQARVGDAVVINGQPGVVEAINLRTIILRDAEGAVHVFPNGAITTFANRMRDYAFYPIDISVDFREDTDKVIEILRTTAAALQADAQFGDAILAPLEIFGVDAFRDGQVTIKSRLKTLPQKQWEVGRELRRRLRIALTAAGIDLPPAGIQTMLSRKP